MSLSDLLAGGAGTIKLSLGETVTGTIRSVTTKQAIDFKSQKPAFWDDGNPKMQILITIDSDQLDEGEGTFYAKAWNPDKSALAAAVAETGLSADLALAPGNQITITHTEERPNQNPALNDTKIYTFRIVPKAPASVGAALADNTPAAPAPAPQAAQQAAPAPAPAPASVTQAAPAAAPQGAGIPALIAAGLTDQQIAEATGNPVDVIAIIRANQPLQEGGNVNAAAPF